MHHSKALYSEKFFYTSTSCRHHLTGLSKIDQKILNNCDQFAKNADFGQFSPLQLRYSQKILRDPVFMSVLVRVKSTTHLGDHNTPELAVKGVFTSKIAKIGFLKGGP